MDLGKFDQEELLSTLRDCFDEGEIEALSRDSGFVRRTTSQLKGPDFLMMNVFDSSDGKERSLNDCCDWLEDYFDISMRKQSLDERYNTDAVRFMKTCLERTMGIVNKRTATQVLKGRFSRIELTDATSFKIPDCLSVFYKGYKRGKGGSASMKIQFRYNLLDGGIPDISLRDGTENDKVYDNKMSDDGKKGGLFIRDLGYYTLDYFNSFIDSGNYFLSRGKSDAVYSILDEHGKYKRIDITDYLPENGGIREMPSVYLGHSKMKVPVRLIIESVPDGVAVQRLDRLRKGDSSKKNYKASEQRKAMCHFNVFITNASEDELPLAMVRLVYSLRWQIELVFKIWKSIFDIDKVKKMSVFRFECYVYAKLIAILLTLHIKNKFGRFLWDEYGFELSPQKAAKLLKKTSQA